MKFTDRSVQKLKQKPERYEVWEDNGRGFGLRISPAGRKSWLFIYRFEGKSRRMTLGVYPKMSLADAHVKHAKALKLLERNIDPGTLDQDKKLEARTAPTVKQLAEEYIEKWAKPRKRSWKVDQRVLSKDVLPAWKHRKAREITRRDVILLLDKIVERGAPIAANRTLALIRKMYNFAMSRDIVPASPCAAITAPSKEHRRGRVLTDTEIKAFWDGLDGAGMAKGTELALKFLLLTAQRKGDIARAEWAEFDLDQGWWVIPADHSKNSLPHRVPLSPQVLEVLEQVKEEAGESVWLFPSPYKKGPITPESLDRAVRNNSGKLGPNHFTPHDLRRTAASQMAGAGIPRLVVSKVLNHVESGITAVYDRHSYDKEKRLALDTWGRKVDANIDGNEGKVITLRA